MGGHFLKTTLRYHQGRQGLMVYSRSKRQKKLEAKQPPDSFNLKTVLALG